MHAKAPQPILLTPTPTHITCILLTQITYPEPLWNAHLLHAGHGPLEQKSKTGIFSPLFYVLAAAHTYPTLLPDKIQANRHRRRDSPFPSVEWSFLLSILLSSFGGEQRRQRCENYDNTVKIDRWWSGNRRSRPIHVCKSPFTAGPSSPESVPAGLLPPRRRPQSPHPPRSPPHWPAPSGSALFPPLQ